MTDETETKTIEDLKKMRDELIERRWREAYYVGSAHHQEALEKVALVHTAIQALDAVIADGNAGPDASYAEGRIQFI